MLNSASQSERNLLGSGWEISELEVSTIVADGVGLRRTGVAAKNVLGNEASGAAVSIDEDPRPRAFFELFERTAMMDACSRESFVCRDLHGATTGELPRERVFPVTSSDRSRFARSNGVALGSNWSDACRRALFELVERDAILRSWLGAARPTRVSISTSLVPATKRYVWEAYRLRASSFAGGAEVAMVFGFPSAPGVPIVRGSAARGNLDEAIEAAMREALQMLGFLWGEEIPSEEPPFAPTPMFHLDFYLWPERHHALEAWLKGGRESPVALCLTSRDERVTFAEIKSGGLPVVRALCNAAVPLWFGDAPAELDLPSTEPHPIA